MEFKALEYQEFQDYGILYLNKPESLNALSPEMIDDLLIFFSQPFKEQIRFLLIFGKGKCFGAGGDMKAMISMDEVAAAQISQKAHQAFQSIGNLPFPVIACVHGFAVGGGLELALACDIVFSTHDAWFSLPELQFGMLPGGGGTVRFPQRVGYQNAFWYLLSGEKFSAQQALAMGIVQKIFEPEQFNLRVVDTVKTIVSKIPSESVSILKKQLKEAENYNTANYNNEAQRFSYLLNKYAKFNIEQFFKNKK